MPWFAHRVNGVVASIYQEIQPGYAEEILQDNDPAVMAILAPPVVPDPADSGNLPKAMKALLLVMATWSGKTPVQAKAAFLAAWNALP